MEDERLDKIETQIDQIALENRDLDIRLTKLENKEVKNNGRNTRTNICI